jgi:AcrR family transcriptional regulator
MENADFIPGDKRDSILLVALELFGEYGFDATSVRMIAEKANVNVAMISYYFGSKEKMFEELLVRKTNYMRNQLNYLLENTELDPWQKIQQLIDNMTERILLSGGAFHRMLIREITLRKRENISQMVEERFNYNRNAFSLIIKEGVDKNIFRSGMDIPLLMNTMIGTIMQTNLSACMSPAGPAEESAQRMHALKNHLKSVFAHYLLLEPSAYAHY